jgi:tRNA 2-thiouridine synthesizing protein A
MIPSLPPIDVDATGWRCPMPVLLMERALRRLGPGESLVVAADDPLAAVDIPHYCAARGASARRLQGPEGVCVFQVTAGGNNGG